jgi:hypothetical protein
MRSSYAGRDAHLVVAPLVVSPPLRAAFPAVARRLPHEAALSMLHPGPDLSGPAALLTLTAWAAAAALAAGWASSRR